MPEKKPQQLAEPAAQPKATTASPPSKPAPPIQEPKPSVAQAAADPPKKAETGDLSFNIETSRLEVDDAMFKPAKPVAVPQVAEPEPPKKETKPKSLQAKKKEESTDFKIETTVMDTDEVETVKAPEPKPVQAPPKAQVQKKAVKPVAKKDDSTEFKIEETVATTQMMKKLAGVNEDEEELIKKETQRLKREQDAEEARLAKERQALSQSESANNQSLP